MGGSQATSFQPNLKVAKNFSNVTKKAPVTKKPSAPTKALPSPPVATSAAGARLPPSSTFLVPESPPKLPVQAPPDETFEEGPAMGRKISFTNKMTPKTSAARAPVHAMKACVGMHPTTKPMTTVPMMTMPIDNASPEVTPRSRASTPSDISRPSKDCKPPPMVTVASRFSSATAAAGDFFGRKRDSEAPLRKMRREIAESNYQNRHRWETPTTVTLPYKDLASVRLKTLQGSSTTASKVTFSSQFTSDALMHLAREPANRICALNFANGTRVGGGYKTGAMAQEEDLCRRMPTLYSTLYQARKDRLYPFGPSTCSTPSDPAKYSDVLFTPNLVLARLGEEDKYQFLPTAQQVKVALITAAAPNINFASEVYDLNLMYNTVRAIFIGPKYSDPSITTLVLGAWGCGAFGGNPNEISTLFAMALKDEVLGRLYRDIHFAIPDMDPSNQNAAIFKKTLRDHGINFSDLAAA